MNKIYNRLLQLEYSPMAALNRTYALSRANGQTEAISEAEKINLANKKSWINSIGQLAKIRVYKILKCIGIVFTFIVACSSFILSGANLNDL